MLKNVKFVKMVQFLTTACALKKQKMKKWLNSPSRLSVVEYKYRKKYWNNHEMTEKTWAKQVTLLLPHFKIR